MGQAIPRQQPAVVLRSQFNQLRALLAVALIAVAGLTAAVVILAADDEVSTSGTSAEALSGLSPQERMRVEALSKLSPPQISSAFGHGIAVQPAARQPNVDASPGARYDGGPPSEGSADVTPAELPKVTQQRAFPGLAGQASAGVEAKDEAASAAAIGQSNDGTVTRGSKTDPHGPASRLP
jgi:hypothetical protein